MSNLLAAPSIHQTPDVLLELYIDEAVSRIPPIQIDSFEGQRLYRTLAQAVWRKNQRPVNANDVLELWERIDTLKRGSPVNYGLCGIHFWAADYANSLASESFVLDAENNDRLAAWLDEWPNVCVLGQTGRGKSTTINSLFGIKVAEISHHTACTRTVSDYRLVTGNVHGKPTGVTMWDVPGFGDAKMTFIQYVKLYRRLARKCDVVVFMLDNDRNLRLDIHMFNKLKRRIPSLAKKVVIALNKSDLFFPHDWDEKNNIPSKEMQETIRDRVGVIAENLELKDHSRIVPISALKNWNIYKLVSAMVSAAGSNRGASLLSAVRPQEPEVIVDRDAQRIAKRFGIASSLRTKVQTAMTN